MNTTHIVNVLYISKIVLHIAFLKNQKFYQFFLPQFSSCFQLRAKKLLLRLKNVSNKVATRYDWLPKSNASQYHPCTPSTRKMFTEVMKKRIIVKPIHSWLR